MYTPFIETSDVFLNVGSNPEQRMVIRPLLHAISGQIADAAIALHLYDQASATAAAALGEWAYSDDPNVPPPKLSPGQQLYLHRARSLHARSFVTALRLVRLMMGKIDEALNHSVEAVGEACRDFDAKLPRLKGLRDSIAHQEERAVGLARVKGKLMPIQPKEVPGLTVGPGYFLEYHHGRRFGCTDADGEFAECEVSEDTLRFTGERVECVIAAIK
jgi:hypothetical protein